MADRRTHLTDPLHLAAVALAFVLAALHAYVGVAIEPPGSAASIRFFLIGAVFLAGVVVYLTDLFRPVLYLLGSMYAAFLGLLWVVGGMEYVALGATTGVFGASFFLLTLYLFVREGMSDV